ncbi:MAG: chaperonin HslO [Alphaproteobacteria bacterium]|jgi:molecular chaperone Hsp33|nr:chaperonin HslO [Alphaproteobacteria bacterium]
MMAARSGRDMVAPYQIDGKPVRGRVARLGTGTIDPILKRHDYPPELARLLGEALILAAIVGEALKFDGRLLVQAEGNGPVSMLVAEHTSTGHLRGYARTDGPIWEALMQETGGGRPPIPRLFGNKGVLGLIIVHSDPSMRPYQGVVPLARPTLAGCAEEYFERSEQIPSRIALGVGEMTVSGEAPGWRGGGLLLQKMAGDNARGDPQDAWETASALFATATDRELIDPALPPDRLLYRLFHEEGVRLEQEKPLTDACSCNEARLRETLSGLSDDGLRELVEPDGTLSINCEFCNRHYAIPLADVTGPADS